MWHFRVYLLAHSWDSEALLRTLHDLCEEHVPREYAIDVFDIDQAASYDAIRADGILAVPTIVRTSPLPEVRLIGAISDPVRAAEELGLDVAEEQAAPLASGTPRAPSIRQLARDTDLSIIETINAMIAAHQELMNVRIPSKTIDSTKDRLMERIVMMFRSYCARHQSTPAPDSELGQLLEAFANDHTAGSDLPALIRANLLEQRFIRADRNDSEAPV